MTNDGQLLPFARDLREALAIYARRRWPRDRSGHMAQTFKITKDTAANVLKGHASDATVTAILRAGGWPLALAVVGATIGESLDQFIDSERERLAHERSECERQERRMVALAADLRAGAGVVSDRPSGLAVQPSGRRQHRRRRAVSGRH